MKKRTLIIIICAALAVSLGVGGIVYAEIKKQDDKIKKSEDAGFRPQMSEVEFYSEYAQIDGNCLTDEYEKNTEEYCNIILNYYKAQWNSISDEYKKEILKENGIPDDSPISFEDELKIASSSLNYRGCKGFYRFKLYAEGKAPLDLPRLSYEKVKELGVRIATESEGKTEKEIFDLHMEYRNLMIACFDMTVGSGQPTDFYSLDDSLTKFIVMGFIDPAGPIYIELDETRQNVVKQEIMWPEYCASFEYNTQEAIDQIAERTSNTLLSFFKY